MFMHFLFLVFAYVCCFLQINLGNMYYHGLGVEQDWQKARALYKKTAPKHHNARLLLEELEDEMKKKGMDIEE